MSKCCEHINLRSSTEKKNTDSEKEWLTKTVKKYLPAEELRVEKGCLTKKLRPLIIKWSLFLCQDSGNGLFCV